MSKNVSINNTILFTHTFHSCVSQKYFFCVVVAFEIDVTKLATKFANYVKHKINETDVFLIVSSIKKKKND